MNIRYKTHHTKKVVKTFVNTVSLTPLNQVIKKNYCLVTQFPPKLMATSLDDTKSKHKKTIIT